MLSRNTHLELRGEEGIQLRCWDSGMEKPSLLKVKRKVSLRNSSLKMCYLEPFVLRLSLAAQLFNQTELSCKTTSQKPMTSLYEKDLILLFI